MQKQSLSFKILSRMKESPNGTIYTSSDLGKPDVIRKSLSRLCEEKEIFRLIDGYYTIPYFIKIVQEYSCPTADQLAKK